MKLCNAPYPAGGPCPVGAERYGIATDVDDLENDKPFFVYSQGCYPGAFDNWNYEGHYTTCDSIGEHLVTSEHGAFAVIMNSRYGWGTFDSTDGPSQRYDREFFDAIFGESITELGWANQDSKEDNIGSVIGEEIPPGGAPGDWMGVMRWCYYTINLLGDPTVKLRTDYLSPVALITSPNMDNVIESAENIEIKGYAEAGRDGTFQNYRIEYGIGIEPTEWSSDGIVLVNDGNSPVTNGLLGTLDTYYLKNDIYTIKLSVNDASGITTEDRVIFKVSWYKITSPVNKDLLGNQQIVDIEGTSTGSWFDHYTLEWCRDDSCSSEGIVLTNGGLDTIENGILGTWNTTSFLPGYYDINLTTYYAYDETFNVTVKVYIDNFHYGWPKIADWGYKLQLASFMVYNQPTITDIDSDGKKDLIFAAGDFIYVYNHDGTYVEGWPREIAYYASLFHSSPAVGDLDNDGYNEIVTYNRHVSGSLHTGFVNILNHDGTYVEGWPREMFYSKPSVPAIADINNDGELDIIIVAEKKKTEYTRMYFIGVFNLSGNYLDGWPQELYSYEVQHSNFLSQISVGDLDNDGYDEIVVVQYLKDDRSRVFVLNHDGTHVWSPNGKTSTIRSPVLADIDKDGELEIIGVGNQSILIYNLDESFDEWEVNWPYPDHPPQLSNFLSVGDVNNDGNLEVGIVVRHDPLGEWPRYYLYCVYLYSFDGSVLDDWPVCWGRKREIASSAPGHYLTFNDMDGDEEMEISFSYKYSLVSGDHVESDDIYDVSIPIYAFNPDGSMVNGFPKIIPVKDDFIASGHSSCIDGAQIVDLDNDSYNELIAVCGVLDIRNLDETYDRILVWDLPGEVGKIEWPEFYHDKRHTNNYEFKGTVLIPDSCSDTDGGFKPKETGTVSGYQDGIYYSYTDECVSDYTYYRTIREYSCNGTNWTADTYDCSELGSRYHCYYYPRCRLFGGGGRGRKREVSILPLIIGFIIMNIFGILSLGKIMTRLKIEKIKHILNVQKFGLVSSLLVVVTTMNTLLLSELMILIIY